MPWPQKDGTVFLIHPCEYQVEGRDELFLSVSLRGAIPNRTSEDQKRRLLGWWLPRQGWIGFIQITTGRTEKPSHSKVSIAPEKWEDMDLDPQQRNKTCFGKRCRFDVLRVIHDRLDKPGGSLLLSSSKVVASPLLTRFYEQADIESALGYWADWKRAFISQNGGQQYLIDENRDDEIAEWIGKYDWEECAVLGNSARTIDHHGYDVFICHASEDKDSFVRPLAEALRHKGLRIWYDELTLKLGDSLRQSIEKGLAKSQYGIVALSKPFFAKNWPKYELDGLVQRETSSGEKVILPI